MVDTTLTLVMIAIVIVLVLVIGTIGLSSMLLIWFMRRGTRKNRAKKLAAGQAVAAPTKKKPTPPPPPPIFQEKTEPRGEIVPKGDQGSPFGFFDEDGAMVGQKPKPKVVPKQEQAATELFQRGAGAFDWLDRDDDSSDDEEGATEVFSQHHLDELEASEFNIEGDD